MPFILTLFVFPTVSLPNLGLSGLLCLFYLHILHFYLLHPRPFCFYLFRLCLFRLISLCLIYLYLLHPVLLYLFYLYLLCLYLFFYAYYTLVVLIYTNSMMTQVNQIDLKRKKSIFIRRNSSSLSILVYKTLGVSRFFLPIYLWPKKNL